MSEGRTGSGGTVPHRPLGQTGAQVSAIGIGCMPMIRAGNINYGVADDEVSTRTIHEAIDLGITFFDTADVYGPFRNEELVGEALSLLSGSRW